MECGHLTHVRCVEWLFHFSQRPSVFFKIVPCCIATHTHFCARVAQYWGLWGINPWGTSGMRWPMILGQVWAGGEETRIPLFLLNPTSPLWSRTPLPHSTITPLCTFVRVPQKYGSDVKHFHLWTLTSEEKCPFPKTIFPCTLAKNLFGGLCRWRGDRRTKKKIVTEEWSSKSEETGCLPPYTQHACTVD